MLQHGLLGVWNPSILALQGHVPAAPPAARIAVPCPPGVLAADSVAAASSILHTASLHPHFLWCSLDCGEQQQQQEEEEEGALEGAGRGAGGGSGSADPLSALFEATGGNWDFMVYGKNL